VLAGARPERASLHGALLYPPLGVVTERDLGCTLRVLLCGRGRR
jgi:hypothetical protein